MGFFIAMTSLPTTHAKDDDDVLTPPPSPPQNTVTVPSASSSMDTISRLYIFYKIDERNIRRYTKIS